MEKMYKKIAGLFGLSDYEAKIYLAGLGATAKTISQLARYAQIPRTAAYPSIEGLIREGLLSVTSIGKRKHYVSIPLKDLEALLDRKRVELHEMMQDLPKTLTVEKSGLEVRVFEGINGLLNASNIFLRESISTLWKSFEQPHLLMQTTGKNQMDEYVKRRVERGIHGRVIMPANARSATIKEMLENNKTQLREVVVVSETVYPIEASLAVSGDMIQLVSTAPSIISVLIQNSALASTLSRIHDMIWDRYAK